MRISVFILLTILGVIICADTLYDQIPLGNDFMQDYAAAIALGRGEPIYGAGIGEISYSILGKFKLDNYHPPFSALLFVPLSFFSYVLASWIWLFLSFGFYLLSLFLLHSYVEKKTRAWPVG